MPPDAARTARAHAELGLGLLQSLADEALACETLVALEGSEAEFVSGHGYVVDVEVCRLVPGLDADLAALLGLQPESSGWTAHGLELDLGGHRTQVAPQEVVDGFSLLSALGHVHAASCLRRSDARAALHRVFDLYSIVLVRRPGLAAALRRLLRTPFLDSGNAFVLGIQSAFDRRLAREIDGVEIGEQDGRTFVALRARAEDAGPEDPIGAAATAAIKWRDKWVTWILGQDLVDVPYDQERIFGLLEEHEGEDIDAKRRALHQEIAARYDRRLEGGNIERVSRQIEAEGRLLVCGRISRAFGNQTQLLSNASYVDRAALVPLARVLASRTAHNSELGPSVSRLVKLVLQPGEASYAQLRGALWHLEEALRNHQSASIKRIEAEKEADAERVAGGKGFAHYEEALDRLARETSDLFALATRVRAALEAAPKKPAAFLILQQRLFPGETQLLALANANRDTHPGKIEALRDLTRKGGHNRYASEGTGIVTGADGQPRQASWISKCQHWIEAIPMFIKERIVRMPVRVGGHETLVERIETEVDQRGMEAFFRHAAEFWAENCAEVMDSEHVAVAREFVVLPAPRPGDAVAPVRGEEETLLGAMGQEGGAEAVGAAAALAAASARQLVERIGARMETEGLSRFAALRAELVGPHAASAAEGNLLADAAARASRGGGIAEEVARSAASHGLSQEANRLARLADRPRRPVSALHVLTTESAGMTEGYVQTWLETEMALYNVIKAHGWEAEVRETLDHYRTRISALAEKVVAELGMDAAVQELVLETGVSRPQALASLLATHRPLAEEVARLGVLIEEEERDGRRPDWSGTADPQAVETLLAADWERLVERALPKVAEDNGRTLEDLGVEAGLSAGERARILTRSDEDLAADLDFHVRSLARQEALETLDRERPERILLQTQAEYLRSRTQLALSTARRAVVAAHGAQGLTENPLYNYRATGGKKAYHLLYTPSRVDLGAEEMDSIVRWNQWVGAADASAGHAGREFYALINEAGVEVRPSLAWQEIQKTSENANMTAGKAFANAIALVVDSVEEGDQQLMADQMSLRHDADRGTPAASEGYGGYCVPKDGLFLAFVLGLRSEAKLRQMGVPPALHGAVMALAREAVLHRSDFETDFAWQCWVGRKLLAPEHLRHHLSGYVGTRRVADEDLLVFNLSKVAESVERLGRPWPDVTPGERLVTNLAAQWAVGKMIVGSEQVQRFMVFYKAWLIGRALAESGRRDAGKVVTPAEYKTVQDIRYSGGIRILEILARTSEHLTYSLDEEGQDLVFLMTMGFASLADIEREQAVVASLPEGTDERRRRQKLVDRRRRLARRLYEAYDLEEGRGEEAVAALAAKFPSMPCPADVRLVSTTMASTQDVLNYTDDTQLTQIADRVQQALSDAGISEEQMRANALVYGGDLARWAGVKDLPPTKRDALVAGSLVYRVGAETFEVPLRGAVHALVLRLRGPVRLYEHAIQGADVLNTSIAFKELRDLVDDPPRLVALMLEGNPASALALTDGLSGRGGRMLCYADIMLFFAACDAIAGRGRGSYRAIGLGDHVVARLRSDMEGKRRRAQELLAALERVCLSSEARAREQAVEAARGQWRLIIEQVAQADEALEAVAEEERASRYKRSRPRDRYLTRALTRLATGLDLGRLDFGTWLALGGSYALVAAPREEVNVARRRLEEAVALVPAAEGAPEAAAGAEDVESVVAAFLRPRFVPEARRFEQVLGRESSSKAIHVGETEARERRKALRARQLRIEMFAQRAEGFRKARAEVAELGLEACHGRAQAELDSLLRSVARLLAAEGDLRREVRSDVNRGVGGFLAVAARGLASAVDELAPAGTDGQREAKESFRRNVAVLYGGREIVFEAWKRIAGGYQETGDLPRLVLALGDDVASLERLTKAIELFYATFALAQTVEHLQTEPDRVDWVRFWDDLAVFFAETINDHDCYYFPWAYVRGGETGRGFDRLGEQRLYELAVERHAWLYRYLRLLLTEWTELKALPAGEQDALLGNFLDGREEAGIGADAPTRTECAWRAYNQLREVAFWRNDGFPMPLVFPELDPDLIQADERVNVVFLFPVGRTHISRAVREGPSLSRELKREGRPGVNIVVTRYGAFEPVAGARRRLFHGRSGHLYVSREELTAALARHKHVHGAAAEALVTRLEASGSLTPKGIRIAARFTRPIRGGVLVPYHGNVLYTSGQLEDEGLPYSVQSLIHSDISYDKSLYPQVFRDSGVEMPAEIDWLTQYQEGLGPEEALRQIVEGREGFPGLRRFAQDHPIVLVKGAAESGARNLRVFDVGDGRTDGAQAELRTAALFVYERASKQNMVIQEAARTTPEFWASEGYMDHFVDRQIQEWNAVVARDRLPRSPIYGSLRIIASSSAPGRPYELTHLIALSSLQVATNVGRGGTLEPLRPEFIQDDHRRAIRDGLAAQAPLVMQALERFAPVYEPEFRRRRGKAIGQDLRGVSYGWPAYLMLDFLVTPVFEREGRLVDVEPRHDECGRRVGSRFVLEDGEGRFEGRIVGWRFIHLEPNVGIGLWDRFSLCEEAWERRSAEAEGRPFDWDAVGHDDRIVLRNFAIAGDEYLRANLADAWPAPGR